MKTELKLTEKTPTTSAVMQNINLDITWSKITEPIFRCTAEQREAITQAQQAVARGEGITNKELKNAVELCLNEN